MLSTVVVARTFYCLSKSIYRGTMKLFLAILSYVCMVHSQEVLHCHRCFGSGYCNNASDASFAANVRNATCSIAPFLDFEIQHPLMKQIQEGINRHMLDGSKVGAELNATSRAQCLTATVIEPHDTHTIRTCVIRSTNETLCQAIQNAIQPINWYNGTFVCQECTSHFCNNQTLINATPGSGSPGIVSTSLALLSVAMTSLYLLY